jgi:predicted transcriptional regulator
MTALIEINEKNIKGMLKRMKKLLEKHTVYDSIAEMSSFQEEILKNGHIGSLKNKK